MYSEEFANAILRGDDPPITGEDGRKSLEIVIAAYLSGSKHTYYFAFTLAPPGFVACFQTDLKRDRDLSVFSGK